MKDDTESKAEMKESHKNHYEICPVCKVSKQCSYCKGSGLITKKGLFSTKEIKCRVCDGLGYCAFCGGDGKFKYPAKWEPKKESKKIRCPSCEKIIPIKKIKSPLEFKCPYCEMMLVLKK